MIGGDTCIFPSMRHTFSAQIGLLENKHCTYKVCAITQKVPMGCADAAALDGRRGINVFKVNPWLWQFGRGKPRLGGLTVGETADRQLAKDVDRKKRAAETRRCRKTDQA
jgi:hypothetical protein